MSGTFHITLRDVSGSEASDSREFDVALNANFPVGRASRSTTKDKLMPASNNAYIDSPIVSRSHAVFSANTDSGIPQVYVTDLGSMHGTTVNGKRLKANIPSPLCTGDRLQFGIDLNRSADFFVARKYLFEARFSRAPATFSMGFTVPESDEEEIDDSNADSGSDSDFSDHDHVDMTLFRTRCATQGEDEEEDDHSATFTSDVLHVETFPQTLRDFVLGPIAFSDIEGSSQHSSDAQGDESDDPEGLNTEDSVINDSIDEYGFEIDVAGAQPNTTSDAVVHQTGGETMQSQQAQNSPIPSHASFSPENLYQPTTSEPMYHMPRQGFEHVYTNKFVPPLPPRPSAAPLTTSNEPSWYPTELPARTTYQGANEDRLMPFSSPARVAPPDSANFYVMGDGTITALASDRIQTPPPVLPSDVVSSTSPPPVLPSDVVSSTSPPPVLPSDVVPSTSPPPVLPSDVASSTTPPPSRRTKVSIGEIVEDQPPAPASLNHLKRKADVLEEHEIPVFNNMPALFELLKPETDSVTGIATHSKPSASGESLNITQTAAVIAQRPKKQPKSIASRFYTSAKYVGIGAAGAASALAVLSTLPDAFFF